MADEKKDDITSVMEAAWKQTMGEVDSIPDDFTHLGGEPPPSLDPETPAVTTAAETPPSDTPLSTEEPVTPAEPAQEVKPEDTPPAVETVEAPQHWPEADRQNFAKLTPEGQAFLLRRHKEMEADYTRKTQENAEAVKIGSTAMRNIDPAIQAEIRQAGITADKFVENLIGFHRLSTQNPVEFIRQVTEALGVDPAKVFQGVAPNGAAPPADPLDKRLQQIERFVTNEVQTREQQVRESAKQTIEQFSSEKDASGNPLRPHFEKVRTVMAKLMSVDPEMDLNTAYDVALFRDPELRQYAVGGVAAPAGGNPLPSPVPIDKEKVRRGEEAARAAKANIRGSGTAGTPTSAVPEKMSLAQALKAAADEVGFKQ
jgi:hypothetical protein